MEHLTKLLLAGLSLLPLACAASPRPGGEIDFNAVESQAYFLSDDQMQQKAQDYLDAHFPRGYPIKSAMAALTRAGAECSFSTENGNPTSYVCDYSRPGHGLGYFFIQIDWLISLYFTADHRSIDHIFVLRGETGL
jgi:hypothetical protein